jgi:undecaprenyl-diphosphatase
MAFTNRICDPAIFPPGAFEHDGRGVRRSSLRHNQILRSPDVSSIAKDQVWNGLAVTAPRENRWWWLLAPLFFVTAMLADIPVAHWVHSNRPATFFGPLRTVFWWFGHASSTAIIAILVMRFHRLRWRAASMLAIGAVAAGLGYSVIKWMVGRSRPYRGAAAFHFHPFGGGIDGLWGGQSAGSFPSGHTCLAFAVATVLSELLPLWPAWTFFLGASLVGLFRVLEGAHYPSDVVGGAVVGILAARISLRVARANGLIPAAI